MIIQHAVWLYLRFTLSYRDVEELLAERGLDISYETVRCWVLKFGPVIAQRLCRCRPRPSDRWHLAKLDEMVVRIAGRQIYLWRAVDHEGEVLDILVQRRRDTRAALRLMRKLLKKQGFAPKLLITDKPGSYACAFRRLRLNCPHEQARDGQWVVLEAVPAPAFLHRLQCEDDALRSAEMERRGCALASAVEMRREPDHTLAGKFYGVLMVAGVERHQQPRPLQPPLEQQDIALAALRLEAA